MAIIGMIVYVIGIWIYYAACPECHERALKESAAEWMEERAAPMLNLHSYPNSVVKYVGTEYDSVLNGIWVEGEIHLSKDFDIDRYLENESCFAEGVCWEYLGGQYVVNSCDFFGLKIACTEEVSRRRTEVVLNKYYRIISVQSYF